MLQAIILHPAMKPSAGVVAARLLDHLNTTSLRCNPSYATIAQATGISRDTVMSSVQDLESGGFLIVDRTVELGSRAAKGQRLPSNGFKFDWSKVITQSEKSTTPRRKSRPPQSKISTTPVDNSDHPQSEKSAGGSRNLPPKAEKEETGNLENENRNHPAGVGQLALLGETPCEIIPAQKGKAGNGRKQTRRTKTELAENWVLSEEQWSFGAKLGLTGDQIEVAQRKMKRWCKDQGKRSANWDSFIENWLERELTYVRNSGGSRGSTIDERSGFDDFLNGVDHG
jgi:biotin operon repressor